MDRKCETALFAAVASALVLAGCGGGGGGGAPATNVTSPTSTGSTTTSGGSTAASGSSNGSTTSSSGSGTSSGGSGTSSGGSGTTVTSNFTSATLGSGSTDMNLFGEFTTGSVNVTTTPGSVPTITSPAAATVGTNATPSPTGAQPLTGTAFPLKQSVISIGPSGIAPDIAANTGGATLSIVNWNAAGDSQFRLTIPGLAIDATFTSASLLKGPSTVLGGTFRLTSSNVNYAALGLWEVDTTSTTAGGATQGNIHLGAFTTGYETPIAGMPTSGVATYGGIHNVAGIVTTFPSSGGIARASLLGDGSFSANFSTGAITGAFTNILLTAGTNVTAPTPWNNVSVTSSIIGGTSHFTGSTAATSAPGTPFALSGAATGRIDGGFYGPNANELAAVWSLTDSGSSVIGVAQGAHP